MQTKYISKIRFREDTRENLRNVNPILASSEPCREVDTGFFKIGDGKTPWNLLPYQIVGEICVPEVGDDGKIYGRMREENTPTGKWIDLALDKYALASDLTNVKNVVDNDCVKNTQYANETTPGVIRVKFDTETGTLNIYTTDYVAPETPVEGEDTNTDSEA